MSGLNSKILKSQLLLLFLLTGVSFFAFYFHDSLPDNFMSISSGESGEVGFFSYYGTSFVSFIGYYSGPWIFFPFIIFSVLYTFVFSRRDFRLDGINAILISGLFLSGCMLLSPRFLGDGLFYLFSSLLNKNDVYFLLVFFLISSLACSFRGDFSRGLVGLWIIFRNIPGLIGRTWSVGSNACEQISSKTRLVTDSVKKSVPSKLSGQLNWKGSNSERTSFEESMSPGEITSEKKNDQIPEERNTIVEERREPALDRVKKVIPRVSKNKESKGSSGEQMEMNYFAAVSTVSMKRKKQENIQPDSDYFSDIITRIEITLNEHKIDGEIVNILKGPVVDTFELRLGSGVKVSKVTNTQKELSMSLLGAPIRIVYPMLGKTTVGIEVPRNPREIIYLDEVLNTKEFKDSKYKLPVAMGKDAYGDTFIVDLASMPHMLVAGATGAGKSVFINALLVSLLVKKSPEQMKLILIDPKQLELALYQKLPHLIMPVLTDAKSSAIALMWAVQEMERRYSILKEFGVRNLEGFNDKLAKADGQMLANIKQYYEDEDDENFTLPYIVIVVDEFADLVLTKAGKEIEMNINRLAAKARASGIHLVLATQRPSVDVITGTIKSNFPTRVSFRVTASQDSRTILNTVGAEMLLGKGDMLFKQGAQNIRCHSSFVDEEEVEVLTEKLAEIPTAFKQGAIDYLENGGEKETDEYSYGSHITLSGDSDVKDKSLFDEAVKIVAQNRSASASMLQRRLRIGFNRASNLIDEMEAKGIVGPAEGSKRRNVLVPPIEN